GRTGREGLVGKRAAARPEGQVAVVVDEDLGLVGPEERERETEVERAENAVVGVGRDDGVGGTRRDERAGGGRRGERQRRGKSHHGGEQQAPLPCSKETSAG